MWLMRGEGVQCDVRGECVQCDVRGDCVQCDARGDCVQCDVRGEGVQCDVCQQSHPPSGAARRLPLPQGGRRVWDTSL